MSDEPAPPTAAPLTRRAISDAVTGRGWRYVLAALRTSVTVSSAAEGAQVATGVVAACGPGADGSLAVDLRPRRVVLTLQAAASGSVTPAEIELAHRVSDALHRSGWRTSATADALGARSEQVLEIAVDAADIPAVRPFWKAVLGYDDEPGAAGPEDALVDPVGQGPAVWFQQMEPPRSGRNRIHLDVSVPHDEAEQRVAASLAAGGVLVSDAHAPAFWVLADPEGNEVCVTTWQGRD